MKWTTLTFGKHAGKSLPEIIIKDADWFFWAIENEVFKGKLAAEANNLYRKAQAIKIPKRRPKRWLVEYCYEDDGRFLGLRFVRVKDASFQSPRNCRLPHLDLAYIRQRRTYDKKGCKYLLRDFRFVLFWEEQADNAAASESVFQRQEQFP